jgi:GT2 family glycosyltransferase
MKKQLEELNKKEELAITHKFLKWDFDNIIESKTESSTHGNTAAFMLVSKSLFEEINGFNEGYCGCFEDVEFNLSCLLKNKVNITTSKGVCYHLESQTRERIVEKNDLNRLLAFINENSIIKDTFNRID